MISEQLLTRIKPFIDLQQPQSYYLILSSKTSSQMHLPQDVFYQEGVLTFKNKQPRSMLHRADNTDLLTVT